MTAFFYALTVLIWGTTWIAIHYQLGAVPVEASVVYRFALAAAVLFVGLGRRAACAQYRPVSSRG